jgi:hypothetical protein
MSLEPTGGQPAAFEIQQGKFFVDGETGVWRKPERGESNKLTTKTILDAVSKRIQAIAGRLDESQQLSDSCEIIQHSCNMQLLQEKVISHARKRWDWIPLIGTLLGNVAEKNVKSQFAPVIDQIGNYAKERLKSLDLDKLGSKPKTFGLFGLTDAQIRSFVQGYTRSTSVLRPSQRDDWEASAKRTAIPSSLLTQERVEPLGDGSYRVTIHERSLDLSGTATLTLKANRTTIKHLKDEIREIHKNEMPLKVYVNGKEITDNNTKIENLEGIITYEFETED